MSHPIALTNNFSATSRLHFLCRGISLSTRLVASAILTLTLFASARLTSAQVLTHGPVFGGVTSTSANVFVRTDMAATASLLYSTDPTFTTYEQTETYETDANDDFTLIVPIADLLPESKYYINVLVDGIPQFLSGYPSFSSFPPDGSPRNFSFICMSDFTNTADLKQTVETYASAAALNPAFVFIGGDFDHRQPTTLSARRGMFQELYSPSTRYMADFGNLILRQFPIAHQWDDHDTGDNNDDKNYSSWPDAQQAYEEYVPCYPLPSISPGIWQRFTYAQMDAFVLDCRSQRDDELGVDNADKSMLDGNDLGATGQLQWLENGLLTSTATWKVIFTSVITNTSTKFPDGWAGYQTEWNALKTFINSNNIQNVVFISGDLHLPAIDSGVQAGFPEMCISQPNGLGGCPTAPAGTWSQGYYLDGTCSGFGMVTVSQDPDALTLQALDQYGNIKLSYTVGGAEDQAPVIITQPMSLKVPSGRKATFSVTATGSSPLIYQWNQNGAPIRGATSATYITPKTTQKQNGTFFTVTVQNSIGSILSNKARLAVGPPK